METRYQSYQPSRTDSYPMRSLTAGNGVAMLQQGAFNIFAMVPCPLRPRFNRMYQTWIETYNSNHEKPVYVPTLHNIDHDDVEEYMNGVTSTEDLPDAFIATGSHWVFDHNFRKKFVDSGEYVPYVPGKFAGNVPQCLKEISVQYGIGFIAFGSWPLVYDCSFGTEALLPKSILDLAKPEFEGKITMHGCDGTPGNKGLLKYVLQQGGQQIFDGFAKNVASVKHFSQIMKRLDTPNKERTAFNIMPGAAACQIPSSKNVASIELMEGNYLMPITVLVKRSAFNVAESALSFFYEDEFTNLLNMGGFKTIAQSSPSDKYFFESWAQLLGSENERATEQLMDRFNLISPACVDAPVCGGSCAV